MKILHVVPSFGLGGMEKVMCSVINGLPSRYQHEILAFDKEVGAKRWIKNDQVTFRLFHKPNGNFNFFRALYQALLTSEPDILMTYNWGATDAIWLGRCAGIKNVIHNEHGFNADESGNRQWKRNAVRFVVYRLAQRVVVVSKELKEMMQHSFHLPEGQVTFIPNGLDFSCYSPDSEVRQSMRQELGVEAHEILVGFIGRLDPVKNLDLMLDAFEVCCKQDGAFKLLFVGEGTERSHIESLCQEKKIIQHVLFVGPKEDVLPYLRALDVFILTSLREQMPMSILEAMSVGIPIVATAVGDIPCFVEDGQEGFLIHIHNDERVKGLSSALLKLSDANTRQEMGNSARRKLLTIGKESTMVQQYKELLEKER